MSKSKDKTPPTTPADAFFKMPRVLIDGGWWARLTPLHKDVLLVALYFQSCGEADGDCCAEVDLIAKQTGRATPIIRRAIRELHEMGLMTTPTIGGGKTASRFRPRSSA